MQKQTDYTGNYIYQNAKLSFILTDKGRIIPDSSGFAYEYFIKDHLGNTRVTIKDSLGTAAVQQESHYYPFGLEISALSFNKTQPKNKYLYNGKELQEDFGLDWYDYGKRFYDAEVGRFTGVDPLAVKFSHLSPYNYASNDPVLKIDLWGLQGVKYYDEQNKRIVVEHNVIVLSHKQVPVPTGASQKTIKKINRINTRNSNKTKAKIAQIKGDVKEFLNHGGKGAKNSEGTTVFFDIKVTEMKVDNPKDIQQANKIGRVNAISGTKKGVKTAAMASVAVTTSGSSPGQMAGNVIKENWANAPKGAYAHEIGHRLFLDDDYPGGDGGIMDSPPGPITTTEVDEVLKKSLNK